MKHILTFIASILFILIGVSFITACKNNSLEERMLPGYASDAMDVYAPLKPNEEGISSRHTYGKDSIPGHTLKYRMTTDSTNVFINYTFTALEIHPKITSNLLSFLHGITYDWGFINEKDSLTPWTLEELMEEGLTQQELTHKILDWEKDNFKRQIPNIYKSGSACFNLDVEIYPVFLNEDYITFKKYAYYDTGGAHGNYTSYLQTYNLKTGDKVELKDLISKDKIDILRKHVINHMASSYPIYDNIKSVEQYLDSLNHWLGKTNLGVVMGITKESDLDRINEKNYPLNDPGINETGLVITYDKYQLTPGADGVPVIVITYDEIRDCLNPPFNNYETIMPLEESDNKEDIQWNEYGEWYSKEKKDSIRNSWGLADNGKPFPIDIYDQYEYINGKLKKQYSQKDILGTWYGYGHLYNDRNTLTLNEDGSYELIKEKALQNDNGDIIYEYYSTNSGKYIYDTKQNKITLLNFKEKNKILRDDYIKFEHPEHEEFIIHEIKGNEMKLADIQGDLWSYSRTR